MEFPARVRQLLQAVIEGPLGINFDPLNVMVSENGLNEVVREFHAEIKHVRARDGIRNVDDEVEECPLGMGGVDWPLFLGLLHEADYRNWIVLDRTSGDDRIRDLSVGLSYLRELSPF
jgi:sugar phosphate isomerase/epimerase